MLEVKNEVKPARPGRVLTSRIRLMATFSELAPHLAETGRALHARGWALATAGNFSAVVRRDPLVLAISRSGVDKGRLAASDILQVDGNGLPLEAEAKPSDETVVHLAVVRERGAGAVLHTHSVWNTLLSEAAGDAGGLAISGYEMLKALSGVRPTSTPSGCRSSPNTQDYVRMTRDVVDALAKHPAAPRPAAARTRPLHLGPRPPGGAPARRGLRVPVRDRAGSSRRAADCRRRRQGRSRRRRWRRLGFRPRTGS